MSINKFIFDVQTGKLLTAETYDHAVSLKSRRIVKTRIDWSAVWEQPAAVSFSIISAFTAVRALVDGNWAGFGLAFTFLIAIVCLTLKLFTDNKPSIYVKWEELPQLDDFWDLKGATCIAASSTSFIQGMIALSPTQDTVAVYIARAYSLGVDMYTIYKELFGHDIGYEQPTSPFSTKQAYHTTRAIVDKMKTAQAGFETLPVRLPIEIYDSAMLYRCGFKTMPLNPEIVDWLESIVYVFKQNLMKGTDYVSRP